MVSFFLYAILPHIPMHHLFHLRLCPPNLPALSFLFLSYFSYFLPPSTPALLLHSLVAFLFYLFPPPVGFSPYSSSCPRLASTISLFPLSPILRVAIALPIHVLFLLLFFFMSCFPFVSASSVR